VIAQHFCKTLSSPATICIAPALQLERACESSLQVQVAARPLTNPFNKVVVPAYNEGEKRTRIPFVAGVSPNENSFDCRAKFALF
jgi:hypothetical protein